MRAITNPLISLACLVMLAACAGGDGGPFAQKPAPTPAQPETQSELPGQGGQSAETLDQASPREIATATQGAATGRFLGDVVAILGDVSEPGFWIKTALVSEESKGRAEATDGSFVALTLRPLASDAGAEISLSAMRALGLDLTALAELKLYALP